MSQKELLTKKDVAAIGEEIGHELGADFIKAYETAYPAEVRGYVVGRNIIDCILAQPGCVGLNFYYGLNEAGEKTLVYAGIDAQGNDIVKTAVVMSSGALVEADGVIADRLVIKWPF